MNDALGSLSRCVLLVGDGVLVRALVIRTLCAPSDACLERLLESLRFGCSVANPIQRPDGTGLLVYRPRAARLELRPWFRERGLRELVDRPQAAGDEARVA